MKILTAKLFFGDGQGGTTTGEGVIVDFAISDDDYAKIEDELDNDTIDIIFKNDSNEDDFEENDEEDENDDEDEDTESDW